MSADGTARVAAVIDGTGSSAELQARALGSFLRDGLRRAPHEPQPPADAAGAPAHEGHDVTFVFYADRRDRETLVELAPTRDVRLVRTAPHRPDLVAAALGAFAAGGGADLFVFAGGPLGTALAARLAAHSEGAIATGVLDAAIRPTGLVCRRSVCSNHLVGRFELRPRPWCITTDAGWQDAAASPPAEHVVRADVELADDASSAPIPLEHVELLEPPQTGDLEAAEFLVVAGNGTGGREGVERIAAAAARMGATFGVTRPVAMNAWAPMDRLIGVSGTRTSPAVCITAGVHGAPAFLWGVERAGFIAAIDLDEQAPIASEADAVLLDDAVATIEALADILAADARGDER